MTYLRLNSRDLGEPFDFWDYFLQISKIPRCSKEEDKIREYVKKEATKLNFKTKVDKVGNLVIKIPSIKDNKNSMGVVLQCHLDMVCEKNEEVMHDFSKDPLKLKLIELDGKNWLIAEGTTLGADNGVGIAYLLTLLKRIHNNELECDKLDLELLFTINEEEGLIGAFEIDNDLISGDYLINLDSEEDDRFTIGCAGGINTIGEIKINYDDINDFISDALAIKLFIRGLIGGHSGVDIHRGRANAIKLMSQILWKVNNKFSIYLNSINGGNRANVIPRETQAIFFIEENFISKLKEFINQLILDIQSEFKEVEPNLEIKLEKVENFKDTRILPKNKKNNLFHILHKMPSGPISMHPKIPELVFTSTNLASIKINNGLITITTSQRSLNEISKKEIQEKITTLFELADGEFNIQIVGEYPGWTPDFNARLLNLAKDTYKELFDEEVIIQAIHAGLECGILKKHFPKMDMISIGPTIVGPHSPDERLQIETINKIWSFLVKLLNIINVGKKI